MNPVLVVVDVSELQSISIENGVRDTAVNTGGRLGTVKKYWIYDMKTCRRVELFTM